MLGNFNVFPGTLADARSEDILNALQRAYELGFDVVNMSLGGGSNGIQRPAVAGRRQLRPRRT